MGAKDEEGMANSVQFKKIIIRYKRIGYNMNVMRQTACLVVNNFADLFICMPVGQASRLNDCSSIKQLKVGWVLMICLWSGPPGFNCSDFCCSSVSELVCCWVLVLFHLSDEPWWITVHLFRIAMWPFVGKELSPWLFTCAVFYLF